MLKTFFSKVLKARSILLALVLIAIAAKLFLLFFLLNKGFEIGDEGCFLLALGQPNDFYKEIHLQHQYLLRPLFNLLGVNTFFVRLATLLLEISCSLILWRSIAWKASLNRLSSLSLLFLILIGINNGITTNSIFYLHLSNYISYLLIACLILFERFKKSQHPTWSLLIVFSIGILTGLWWFIKFSSSVLAIILLAIYFFNQSRKWLYLKFLVMGIIVFANFYFLFFQTPRHYIENLQNGFYLIGLQGYNSLDILRSYLLFDVPCFLFFAFTGIFPFAISLYLTNKPAISFWTGLFILISAIILTENMPIFNFFPGYHLKIIHVLLYTFSGLFFMHIVQSKRKVLWLLWFLIFPFVAAFGTAIPLQMSTMSYSLPIVAGIGLLILLSELSLRFKVVISALVTALLLSQYIYLQFFLNRLPHGFQGYITEQTEYLPQEGIYVSKPVKTFISNLNAMLCKVGYKKRDAIIALTDMPGVVYLLGGTSPSTHWYFSKNTTRKPEAANNLNCYHLNRIDYSKKNYLLILENTDPEILNCVKGFPSNYTYLGREFSPYHKQYVLVWVSKNK